MSFSQSETTSLLRERGGGLKFSLLLVGELTETIQIIIWINRKIESKQIQNNSLTTPPTRTFSATPSPFCIPPPPSHTHTFFYPYTHILQQPPSHPLFNNPTWLKKKRGVWRGARGLLYAISIYRKVQLLSIKKPYGIDVDVKKNRPTKALGRFPTSPWNEPQNGPTLWNASSNSIASNGSQFGF